MKSPKVILYIGATLCLGLIFSCLSLFPGAGFIYIAGAAAIGGTAAVALYSNCSWRSTAGWWILLAAATLSLCGAIININYYTVAAGTTAACPVLQNFDSLRVWQWSCYFAFGDIIPTQNITSVGYFFAPLLYVFGRTIAVPVLFCSICYMLTPIVVGSIAMRLTSDRRIALAAMLFTACQCFLFAQSTMLIKDCPVTLGMGVIIYYIVVAATGRQLDLGAGIALLSAITALSLLRPQSLLFISVAAILITAPSGRRSIAWGAGIAVTAIAFHIFSYTAILPSNILRVIQHSVTTHEAITFIQPNPYAVPFDNMFGDYTQIPFYKKLMILPLTVALQFLLPFPWNFGRDTIYGPAEGIAHFGFPWYLAGALILYWLFVCMRRAPRPMQMTVLTGVLFTVATAYMTSGRIARYCLPYLPMLLPAAAYVAVCIRRRSLWIWLGVFSVLLAATLMVCHHLQAHI